VELWVIESSTGYCQRLFDQQCRKFKMAPVWLIFLVCYLAFIVLFMAIPASLGFSFGIRNLYLATLYKVFEVGFGDLLENYLLMNLIFTCVYMSDNRTVFRK